MATLQELLELAEGLQEQGFTIPEFRYRNPKITAPTHYVSSVVDVGIADLGLLVSLSLSLQPRRKRVALSDFKRRLPLDYLYRIQLDYQSLYVDPVAMDGDNFDVPSRKFRDLPKQLKREIAIITDLSDYLEDYDAEGCRQKQYSPDERRQSPPFLSKTWGELFGILVRERKLQWMGIEDQKVPYVRTTSDMISDAYRNRGGLIFVAADVVKEGWQEQIAVHYGYWLADSGIDIAKVEAAELALRLGKERDYLQWHQEISDRFGKRDSTE